jgi:hypothetical protein
MKKRFQFTLAASATAINLCTERELVKINFVDFYLVDNSKTAINIGQPSLVSVSLQRATGDSDTNMDNNICFGSFDIAMAVYQSADTYLGTVNTHTRCEVLEDRLNVGDLYLSSKLTGFTTRVCWATVDYDVFPATDLQRIQALL